MIDRISKYILIIACCVVIGYAVWNVATWSISITNAVIGLNDRVTAIERLYQEKK
jgi:hypothetical protein